MKKNFVTQEKSFALRLLAAAGMLGSRIGRRRRKRTPPTRRVEGKWVYRFSEHVGFSRPVFAMTKSEARALIKKGLGLRTTRGMEMKTLRPAA